MMLPILGTREMTITAGPMQESDSTERLPTQGSRVARADCRAGRLRLPASFAMPLETVGTHLQAPRVTALWRERLQHAKRHLMMLFRSSREGSPTFLKRLLPTGFNAEVGWWSCRALWTLQVKQEVT